MMRPGIRFGVARMLAELLAGPCTTQELIDCSDLADSTVREWLQALRREGVARVCAWESLRNGQVVKPVYELNPDGKPDTKRPKAATGSNRAARYRMRQRLRAQGVDAARIEMIALSTFPLGR